MIHAIHKRHPRRAILSILASLIVVGIGATPALASPPPAGANPASATPGGRGMLDADVDSNSGATLGYLQGDLDGRGQGILTLSPSDGSPAAPEVVSAEGRARSNGDSSITARGDHVKLTITIRPGGQISGSGRLDDTDVRLDGIGRAPVLPAQRGMEMLVVGHPSGPGYDALKSFFKPVPYRSCCDTRAAFLADDQHLDQFGAVVFGRDIRLPASVSDGLLNTFYGTGRWVVVAPSSPQALKILAPVFPTVVDPHSPALAIRAAGPEGNSFQVHPTIAFPTPAAADDRLSEVERQIAAQSRKQWFLSELERYGTSSTSSSTSDLPGDRLGVTSGGSSVGFSLPYNAAAIEIAVPYYHEFTVNTEQNSLSSQPCGWNQTTWKAWCPDTAYWKQAAGGDVSATCNWFLQHGYDVIDAQTVHDLYNPGDSSSGYNVHWYDFDHGFVQAQSAGDHCPDESAQTGNIQGQDYYYAIYEPTTQSHTLVILTDPTISASINGKLVHDGWNGSGRIETLHQCDGCKDLYTWDGAFLQEDAFFLGAYRDTIKLSAPQLTTQSFEYSGNQSFPNNQITFSNHDSSRSSTSSISVGVFGSDGTLGYGQSVSESAAVSVEVPDWQVSPAPGSRTITYDWTTNTPLSWSTITSGGGGPFHDLNNLNSSDFSPTSLTVWTGADTWGKISVENARQIMLVDHYSTYNGDGGVANKFHVTTFTYDDNPDSVTPTTKNPVSPGINLCDPMVASPRPAYQQACKGS